MKSIFVIGLLVFMIYSGMNGIRLMNEPSNGEVAGEIIDSINKTAPAMVDNDIRLDGALLKNEEVFVNYTLVRKSKNEINVSEFSNFIKNDAKSKMCNNIKLKEVVDRGILIQLVYKDKYKQPVFKFNLNKKLCYT